MSFLDSLNWRSATKSFDKTKKVSDAQLNQIHTAIQMSPSSFGLQPFYVKVVRDAGVLAQLQVAGRGQDQFASATEVLVFVRKIDVKKRVEEYFTGLSGGKPEVRASMKAYEDIINGFTASKDEAFFDAWTARQVYIALGFGMAACAELKIDSCPIEGFDPVQFDKILGLPKDERSTVVLAVGYRNPAVAPLPKFRFPLNQMVQK